jgi:D-xylose transport system permease protein
MDNTAQPAAVKENALARLLRQADIDNRMLAMIIALLVIWVTLNIMTGGIFLTARNMYNLAVQSSVVGIMATGMVLVIVSRHIDLSVGSLLGFTGMVIAYLQVHIFPLGASWNWPLTILCGLVLGGLVGLWQGWWISYRGVPAFVTTLAGLLMFRGAAYLVTDGRTVAPMDKTYQILGGGIDGSIGATGSWILAGVAIAWMLTNSIMVRRSYRKYGFKVKPLWVQLLFLAVGTALVCGFVMVMNSYYKPRTEIPRGIPVPVLIMICVVLGMNLLSKTTRFGRYVFAIGGNPEAQEDHNSRVYGNGHTLRNSGGNHDRAAECRREFNGHAGRVERHCRCRHRRHVAGRRPGHRHRRYSGGGDHAKPGQRHGPFGHLQRHAPAGNRCGPDPRRMV